MPHYAATYISTYIQPLLEDIILVEIFVTVLVYKLFSIELLRSSTKFKYNFEEFIFFYQTTLYSREKSRNFDIFIGEYYLYTQAHEKFDMKYLFIRFIFLRGM